MLSGCRDRQAGRGMGWTWLAAAWLSGMLVSGMAITTVRADLPYDRPPINYLNAPVNDPVARLQERLDRGELRLKYDRQHGYLESVLEALGIAPESQMLVFSKTSFQHTRISPRTPRALYFNDNVYIGWVQGGDVLEVSSVDPEQGAVFYLLDQQRSTKPTFERETHACLACHSSGRTQDVPGHLVRSVYPRPDGMPLFNAGSFVSGHESPFQERWGGWYVTGTSGVMSHMGNVVVHDKSRPEQLDSGGTNVEDLSDRFNTAPYLTPHSDIVALMVLEHQTQLHDRITAASYQTRIALDYEKGLNKAFGRPLDHMSPTTQRRIDRPAEELLRYLLFVDETPLTDPVRGTSGYAEQFAARGPRDGKGRSLRDFDLKTRLFRYPCSYLIYSEAFDALPPQVKQYVYRRLREVLTGADQSPEFSHLSAEDRRAIFEILIETKTDLPDDWKTAAPPSSASGDVAVVPGDD